jgi:deoxyribonuclease-4
MRIGAHMSVAGGVSKAVDRAEAHGCEALQIFCKNASQWRGKPIDRAEAHRFRTRLADTGLTPAVSHASYLINLATTVPALRDQSIAALIDELDRAELLGLLGVVIHPGTCTGGTEDEALRLIADALRVALNARSGQDAMILLEHTAGQGRTVGYRFEHLRAILTHLDGSRRVGVCLDTCHLLASGYDIADLSGFARTFDDFDRLVGLDRLKLFHANDSKRPRGSRIDRHEHIGKGFVGLEPFRRLLTDSRFSGLAMLIETEKADGSCRAGSIVVDGYDRENLETLRRLRAQTP